MGQWVRVRDAAAIPPGGGRPCTLNGWHVAVFNDDGEFCAIDGTCPHRGGPLGEGLLARGIVTCPWHEWTFDIRTGENPLAPGSRVATYPVRRVNDELEVQVPDARPPAPWGPPAATGRRA